MTETLDWLETWYRAQCDGHWEHSCGVLIDTLDNPGWAVSIDLAGTRLEGKQLLPVKTHTAEDDWIEAKTAGGKFEAVGDPGKLTAILELFRAWVGEVDGKGE